MENVTHSLIGVVLGEGMYRRTGGPSVVRRGLIYAAVLGSNLPDFDFILRPFVDGNLGYLLHHRGYTHTVLASVPLALIAAGAGRWASRGKLSWSLAWLAGWVGVLCHMGADFWNDYGVHPFWPLNNDWLYGDFIFILEPLFWLSLLPFAFRVSVSWWAWVTCGLLWFAMLGAAWSGMFMHWHVALWLTAWALGWLWVYRKPRSVVPAFASILVVLVMFAGGAQLVRRSARAMVPPGETLLQLSTTPAPGNPLCWKVLMSTEASPDKEYVARMGVFAVRPFGLDWGGFVATGCHLRGFGETDVLVRPPRGQWLGVFRGSLKEFAEARKNHCRVNSLLRFVRMPFWQISQNGQMVVGDLRYHRGQGLGFADLRSRVDEPCPEHDPPWGMPSGL